MKDLSDKPYMQVLHQDSYSEYERVDEEVEEGLKKAVRGDLVTA